MNQMIEDLGLHGQILILLRENSKAIGSSKNPVHHSRIRHIDMRYHFILDLIKRRIENLGHIGTDSHVADACTETLVFEIFSRLRNDLCICIV